MKKSFNIGLVEVESCIILIFFLTLVVCFHLGFIVKIIFLGVVHAPICISIMCYFPRVALTRFQFLGDLV